MAELDGLLDLYFGGDLDAVVRVRRSGRRPHRRGAAGRRDHRARRSPSSTTPCAARRPVRGDERLSALDGLHVLEGSYGIATRVRGQVAARPGRRGGEARAGSGEHFAALVGRVARHARGDGTGALAAFLDAGKARVTVTTHGERDVFWWGRHWADVVIMERGTHVLRREPVRRPVRSRITRPRR